MVHIELQIWCNSLGVLHTFPLLMPRYSWRTLHQYFVQKDGTRGKYAS